MSGEAMHFAGGGIIVGKRRLGVRSEIPKKGGKSLQISKISQPNRLFMKNIFHYVRIGEYKRVHMRIAENLAANGGEFTENLR
jgi:hypothetical protein